MDYKEKVIAILNSQELSKEQKEKLENIFPELKENKDERIREELIELISCMHDADPRKKGWIAWLEKQREQKSIYNVNFIEKQGEKDKPKTWRAEDEQNLNVVLSFIDDEYLRRWLKDKLCYDLVDILPWEVSRQAYQISWDCGKTFEQAFALLAATQKAYQRGKEDAKKELKTLEDNKPKFKVGDFIANDYCSGKVIEITNDAYLLDTGQGIPFSYEHNAHLWTINDAKDGDVLVTLPEKGSESNKQIFLFKMINNRDYVDDCIEYYCRLCDGVFYENTTGYMGTTLDTFYPATKEQRDLLFQKMRGAGYEWNGEKKELKKIETKTLNADDILPYLGNNQVQDILEDMGMLDDNGQCPHTAEEIFKAGMEHAFNLNREAASSVKMPKK